MNIKTYHQQTKQHLYYPNIELLIALLEKSPQKLHPYHAYNNKTG